MVSSKSCKKYVSLHGELGTGLLKSLYFSFVLVNRKSGNREKNEKAMERYFSMEYTFR